MIMNTSFFLICVCALLLMAVGMIFAKPILLLFGSSENGLIYAYPYLMIYLLNSWIPRDLTAIVFFTAIFAVGYALVWVCIYCSIKAKTDRINKKLRGEAK